jgi:hypothetical protein
MATFDLHLLLWCAIALLTGGCVLLGINSGPRRDVGALLTGIVTGLAGLLTAVVALLAS